MTQLVKALADKLGDSGFIPMIHMVKGKNQLPQVILISTCPPRHARMHARVHTLHT